MLLLAQLERMQLLVELASTHRQLARLVAVAALEAGAQAEEVHLEQIGVGVAAQLVEADEELLAGEQVVVVVHLQRLAPPLLGAWPRRAHHRLVHQRDDRVLGVAAGIETFILDLAPGVRELCHDVRAEGAVAGSLVVARGAEREHRREALGVRVRESAHRAPRSDRTTKSRPSMSASASTRWNANVDASLMRVQRRSATSTWKYVHPA